MWKPYHGPEPFEEVCDLCGVFGSAERGQLDPPAASLPCPEPWPDMSELTQEEMAAMERVGR